MAKMFRGITPVELRRIAFEFIHENEIPSGFNSNKETARTTGSVDLLSEMQKLAFAGQKCVQRSSYEKKSLMWKI
jgi:hypothetical protein